MYFYLVIVAGTTFSRYWQIRVDQIPCGTLYTPPQGCLEYHMDTYGNFKSFNFGLNDADYHSLGTQVDISTRISSYLHILISIGLLGVHQEELRDVQGRVQGSGGRRVFLHLAEAHHPRYQVRYHVQYDRR